MTISRTLTIIIGLMGVLAFLASLPTRSTYASIVYTTPFAVLFLITFKSALAHQAFGAATGAAIPIAWFHYLFLYDIWFRLPNEGGGANIGLGLLVVFVMPFLVLFSALMGWLIGHRITMRSTNRSSPDR